MESPQHILKNGTRVITHEALPSTAGMLIDSKHLQLRKANTPGAICGIVGGHGGDVYWVAHVGDAAYAAYSFDEFELVKIEDPCPVCDGSGFDWETSRTESNAVACKACNGSGEKQGPRPTVWERLLQE